MAFSGLIALTVLFGQGTWQSYTNTNFINDIWSDDSVMMLATAGGFVVALNGEDPPRVIRTVVNTDGLPVNKCLCLVRDSAGNVWVGTDGGGLAVICPDSSRAIRYRSNDMPARITCLNRDGLRLLVGSDQGLYVIETRGTWLEFDDDSIYRFSTMRVPELLSDRILSLLVESKYWVGTNRGVTTVDRNFNQWTGYRQPLGDSVKAIAFFPETATDRSGSSVIVATERGLARFDSTGFLPVVRFRTPMEVFDLAVSGRDIYVASKSGLFRVDSSDTSGMVLMVESDARALYIGPTLWLGLGGEEQSGWGIRYLRTGQSWQEFWTPCLGSANIGDCAVLRTGEIYLCHGASYISTVKQDGPGVIVSPLPVAVQARCDSRGRLWFAHFASDGGLSCYDPQANSWQTFQWGASSAWNIIDAFGIDANDTKWVFNAGAIVVAIDSTGQQEEFSIPELAPPPGGGYEFAFDSKGRVWLGLTVGLEMLDYGGTLHDKSDDRHQLLTQGLPSTEVRSVAVDSRDHVWVATPQGAAVWDGTRFRLFRTFNSEILSNNLYRVRVDGSDRVWFLSDAGLSVLDAVSGNWTNYTSHNSGLIGNIDGLGGFYTSLALNDRLGIACIGTGRGLSVFKYIALPETIPAGLRIYPNPCLLGKHNGVVIDDLPPDATVRIWSPSGKKVAELSVNPGLRRAIWYPDKQASGLYIVGVTSSLGFRTDRIAIVQP